MEINSTATETLATEAPVTLTPKEQIIAKIKAIMEQLGLSQAAMAKRLGCHPTMVNRWLKGRNEPSRVYKLLMQREFSVQL